MEFHRMHGQRRFGRGHVEGRPWVGEVVFDTQSSPPRATFSIHIAGEVSNESAVALLDRHLPLADLAQDAGHATAVVDGQIEIVLTSRPDGARTTRTLLYENVLLDFGAPGWAQVLAEPYVWGTGCLARMAPPGSPFGYRPPPEDYPREDLRYWVQRYIYREA